MGDDLLERMQMLAGGNEEGELLIKRYGECVKSYEIFLMKLIKYNLSNASEHEKKTAGDFAAWYCAEKEYIYQFILLLEE